MAENLISKSQWKEIVGYEEYYSLENFLLAVKHFTGNGFLNVFEKVDRKRELAAFLAHCAHETGGFGRIEEATKNAYQQDHPLYPPHPGRQYFGRGPLQLSWNYNYGAFGEFCFKNKWALLEDPAKLSEDGVLGFESAIWYWMTQPSAARVAHRAIYRFLCPYDNWGFGRTIMAINGGLECDARADGVRKKDLKVRSRIEYYQKFARILGIRVGEYGEQLDTEGIQP